MKKLVKPFTSLYRLNKRFKSLSIAYRFLPFNHTLVVESSIEKKNGITEFVAFNKSFSDQQFSFFNGDGELLQKFVKASGISFLPDSNNRQQQVKIILNKEAILLNVSGYETLKVIEEVFINHLYWFDSAENYVVCDIGMNVAAASLYFASFENIKRVYGFEPFPETFKLANENIALNGAIANKIILQNAGVGNKNESLRVPLPEEGSLGGSTTASFIEKNGDSLKTNKNIEIQIVDIVSVINQVKSEFPGCKIILKLDCEGAEYDIMNRLKDTGMVNDISVFMVEYHFRGTTEIKEVLRTGHFFTMSAYNEDINPYGMLYAINLQNS